MNPFNLKYPTGRKWMKHSAPNTQFVGLYNNIAPVYESTTNNMRSWARIETYGARRAAFVYDPGFGWRENIVRQFALLVRKEGKLIKSESMHRRAGIVTLYHIERTLNDYYSVFVFGSTQTEYIEARHFDNIEHARACFDSAVSNY